MNKALKDWRSLHLQTWVCWWQIISQLVAWLTGNCQCLNTKEPDIRSGLANNMSSLLPSQMILHSDTILNIQNQSFDTWSKYYWTHRGGQLICLSFRGLNIPAHIGRKAENSPWMSCTMRKTDFPSGSMEMFKPTICSLMKYLEIKTCLEGVKCLKTLQSSVIGELWYVENTRLQRGYITALVRNCYTQFNKWSLQW